jgi:HD superfamily phosphodiesterase
LDTTFESKILALLAHRQTIHGLAASITCEEAEQEALENKKHTHPGEEDPETARESPGDTRIDSQSSRTRERCRQAARRLAARGEILISQNGKVVDPSFAKGVMELKLPS